MVEQSNRQLDIGYLLSHPIQYQSPLLRELSDRDGVSLKVYYCSKEGVSSDSNLGFGAGEPWDVPLLEGYEYEFLTNYSPRPDTETIIGQVNLEIVERLRNASHDVFWVHDYGAITNVIALLTAPLLDIPTILRAEATIDSHPLVRSLQYTWLRGCKKFVTAFCSIGSTTREVYQEIGIDEERIFTSPYAVDNEFFQKKRTQLPDSGSLREELDIPGDRPVILFVGKLIERKQPEMLLSAFLRATNPGDATLLFVGDGTLRSDLEKQVNRSGRDEDVEFAGFVNYSELPKYYEISDVFTLPSREENWGLVVNEAMNFGLPVIATTSVGAVDDLVDETNGWVIQPNDEAALTQILSELIDSRPTLKRMGQESLSRIQKWGIQEAADGIIAAAEYAVTTQDEGSVPPETQRRQ